MKSYIDYYKRLVSPKLKKKKKKRNITKIKEKSIEEKIKKLEADAMTMLKRLQESEYIHNLDFENEQEEHMNNEQEDEDDDDELQNVEIAVIQKVKRLIEKK